MVLTLFLLADYALLQSSGVFFPAAHKDKLTSGLLLPYCKNHAVAGRARGAAMGRILGKQRGQARGSRALERVPGHGQKEGWCIHTSGEVGINRGRSMGAQHCHKSQRQTTVPEGRAGTLLLCSGMKISRS